MMRTKWTPHRVRDGLFCRRRWACPRLLGDFSLAESRRWQTSATTSTLNEPAEQETEPVYDYPPHCAPLSAAEVCPAATPSTAGVSPATSSWAPPPLPAGTSTTPSASTASRTAALFGDFWAFNSSDGRGERRSLAQSRLRHPASAPSGTLVQEVFRQRFGEPSQPASPAVFEVLKPPDFLPRATGQWKEMVTAVSAEGVEGSSLPPQRPADLHTRGGRISPEASLAAWQGYAAAHREWEGLQPLMLLMQRELLSWRQKLVAADWAAFNEWSCFTAFALCLLLYFAFSWILSARVQQELEELDQTLPVVSLKEFKRMQALHSKQH